MAALKVKYVIPEDGDSVDHPNVFRLPLQQSDAVLTLATLRQKFPVPGSYHFRYLGSAGGLTVWRDLTYDEDCLPASHDGIVFVKASRLQAPEINNMHVGGNEQIAGTASTSRPIPQLQRLLSFGEGNKNLKGSSETDLLGRSPAVPDTDLLGFDHVNKPTSQSSPDLFGLQSITSTSQPMKPMKQSTTQIPLQVNQYSPPLPGKTTQFNNNTGYPYGSAGNSHQQGSRPANFDAFSGLTDLNVKK